jgi:hypothetical protein
MTEATTIAAMAPGPRAFFLGGFGPIKIPFWQREPSGHDKQAVEFAEQQ